MDLFWLREMTFCTYCDAIRTILPAGMQLQIVQKTVLIQPKPNVRLSDEEERYYQILNTAPTSAAFQKRLHHPLAATLLEKGLLQQVSAAKSRVQESKVKLLSLADPLPERKMTPKQQSLVKLLQEKEACRRCGITKAVVQSAEKNGLLVCEMRVAEPIAEDVPVTESLEQVVLTEEQESVMEQVLQKVLAEETAYFLLHGGSWHSNTMPTRSRLPLPKGTSTRQPTATGVSAR